MPTATYKTKVQPGGTGPWIDVQVQANHFADAKRLLEAQYGKGNVRHISKV